MSTTIMGQCWPLKMPPSPKAVLISLADNANDRGECYPSIPTICERTCLGRTAVIEAIKWLEQHGAVVADRTDGRHTTYCVTPGGYVNPSATRTGEAVTNQSATRTRPANGPVRQTDYTSPPGGRDQSAKRTLTVKEPSRNRQEKNTPARPDGVAEQAWSDWLALRRSKRAEVTPTALAGVQREAEKAGWTLNDVLAECCARGWAGFKAEWVADRGPPARASPKDSFMRSMTSGAAAAATNHGEIVDVEPFLSRIA